MRMPRATYTNVMATAAVVLAMTGTAVAATQINGHNIVDRSTPGKKLVLHTVTSKEIKTGLLPATINRVVKNSAGGTSPLIAMNKLGTFEVGCSNTGHSFTLDYTNTTSKPTHYAVTKTGAASTLTQGARVAAGSQIVVTVSNPGGSGDDVFQIVGSFFGVKALNLQLSGLTRYTNHGKCAYSFSGTQG